MSLALDELGRQAEAAKCAEVALKIFRLIESPHAEQVKRKLAEWKG